MRRARYHNSRYSCHAHTLAKPTPHVNNHMWRPRNFFGGRIIHQRPEAAYAEPEQCLRVPGIVIELLKLPTAVVGPRLSKKSRMRKLATLALAIALTLSGCKDTEPSGTPAGTPSTQTSGKQMRKAPTSAKASLSLSEQFTQIEGTGVSLRLPLRCERVEGSSFYVLRDPKVSIGAMQLPGPLDKRVAEVRKTSQTPGVRTPREEKIRLGEHAAHLIRGRGQDSLGNWHASMSVLLGRGDTTVMIIAATPEPVDDAIFKTLETCLKTARWDPDAVVTPLDLLEFTVRPDKDLKLGAAVPGMQAVTYRESGKPKPQTPGEAFFQVMHTILPEAPANRREWFAQKLLPSDTASMRLHDLNVESVQEVRVDGMQGFEGICAAHKNRDNVPQLFYVAALFKSDKEFYRIWGLAKLTERERFGPQFKRMTRSFKLKRKE